MLNIALLAAAALLLGVVSVYLMYDLFGEHGALYISALVAADVVVLVGYIAWQIDKVILNPIREAMDAAEAIAAGNLERRLPEGETLEMSHLADSVNRMTDRLLEERAHLVRVEKMASVGRLAAGVAHEIGNPLGAINGYAYLMRTAQPGSAQATDAIAGLEREAARIDRIVRGLLDYARPRASARGVVDIADAAKAIVELLTTQGALRHVVVRFDAPPTAQPVFAAGERHDLEQAFVNLILNAVDAMEGRGSMSVVVRRTTREELRAGSRRSSDPGDRPPTAPNARVLKWLESAPRDDVAMVAISDSGPGIPADDAERIFEPFYTTKPPGKGTGLGLAIVARAIENFAGTIWVSPSREGGAAFRILIPLAQEPRASRPVSPTPRSVAHA